MASVTALLTAAATFWTGAAPGIAEQNCPDGVRYNVKPVTQMINQHRGVKAEAREGGCVITFRAGALRSMSSESAYRLVVHEYGHAAINLGHEESGIMAPLMEDWLIPVPSQFKTRR
jgi:hypothetical protein